MLRRKLYLLTAVILLGLPAGSSSGLDIAGSDLLIPIVGRVPGAFGSQWQTDIVVTNASRKLNPIPVTVTFHPEGRGPISLHYELQPRGSITLHDAVLQAFGLPTATGIVRVESVAPSAKLYARARIYNVGSMQGEFGQTLQAAPVEKLGHEIYLSGLSGVGANRTNVGVANPADTEANVFISLFSKDGDFSGGFGTTVQPNRVLQINDIFGQFQTGPLHDATIVVTSATGVYAYGSIVRSDSGDADFVTGISGSLENSNVITPSCAEPAPLQLAPAGWEAGGWLVGLDPETDATQVAAELESRFGFTIVHLYAHVHNFLAELSPEVIAALRCEPVVEYVQQNRYYPAP